MTLLAHFWNNQKPLDDDDQCNARLCNLTTNRYRKIKNLLLDAGKIKVKNGLIWNDKAAKTLDNSLSKSAKNSALAKVAAEARWAKHSKKAEKKLRKSQPFPEVLSGKNGENMEVSSEENAENSQSDDASSNAPSNAPSNANQSQSQNYSNSTSSDSYTNPDIQKQLKQAAAFEIKNKDYEQLDIWLADGLDFEKDIIPTIKRVRERQAKKGDPPGSLKYFDQAIREANINRQANGPANKIINPKDLTIDDWCKTLGFDMDTGEFKLPFSKIWYKTHFPYCPPPPMPGCIAPPELQKALLKCWGETR